MINTGEIILEKTVSVAGPDDCGVYRCSVGSIMELRHRILRAGQPLDTARFDGDDLPTTYHFLLAFPLPLEMANLVCCATFMRNTYHEEPAFQLRGMATDTEFQGRGFGKILLETAQSVIAERTGIRLFWCNARMSAVRFYEKKSGWTPLDDSFIYAGIPHRVMVKKSN